MNNSPLKTPTIRVPGLLSDDALQEQLKVYKQNFNGGATQAPTGAVEMADRVQSEFFDAPVRNALKMASALAPAPLSPALNLAATVSPAALNGAKPVDGQQQAIDVRSDILSDTPTMGAISSYVLGGGLGLLTRDGGMLDEAGTLTPAESEQQRVERAQSAKDYEASVKRTVGVRDQLRNLTNDQLTAMGMPIQPGTDAQTDREQRELLAKADQDRIARAEEGTVAAAKAPAPTKAWWLDALRYIPKQFSAFQTSVGKGAAIGLWELPGEISGMRDEGRSDLRAWFDTVDATMNKLLPADEARKEDFINQLSGGAGSFAGFLAGGLLGNVLGLPAKASTLLVGAAAGGTQQYEDAEKFDAGLLQRFVAFMAGSGLGATEAIPINNMLMRAESATGGLVTRMLKNTAASSLEEFIQELGQNVGQDIVAEWTYDAQRSIDWKGALKAAAAGGILGALGGSAATTLETSGVIQRKPVEDGKEPAPAQDVVKQAEFLERFFQGAQQTFDALTQENVPSATETTEAGAATDAALAEAVAAPDASADMATRAPAQLDLKTLMAEVKAKNIARREQAAELSSAGAAVRFNKPDGRRALAGPDMSNPGKFRLTRIDGAGPYSHAEFDTLAEAVDSGLQEGFTPQVDAATEATATLDIEGEELVNLASRAPKSEAFKTWFGESKVIDEAGAPLVVYHGSNADFSEFSKEKRGAATKSEDAANGFFFTDNPAVASSYADMFDAYQDTRLGRALQRATGGKYAAFNEMLLGMAGRSMRATGGNVMPLYLSMENPREVAGDGKGYDEDRFAVAIEEAVKNGNDGVVFRNVVDGGFDGTDEAADIFVAFEPTQIKSVNNAGNFDPSNPDILAARGNYTGEQSRPTGGVAGQTAAASDNINLRQIADNFSKLLGLTVRQGRFTLKGADVMGQYGARSGVIRLRTPNDLSTLVHEGGHALMLGADGPLKKFIKDNDALLKIAARRLYGGDTAQMSDGELIAEGFAEFFRIYTLSRPYAQANFAQLSQDFATILNGEPQLRDGLQIVGDQYAAWLQLPSSQLLRNMVVSGVQTVGINAAIEDMRKEGLVNWVKEWANGAMTATINRNNNLNRLVGDILNVAQKSTGKALDLKRADDPRTLIRMATNAGNRAMVQLTDGVMPYRSTEPTTVGLRDVLLTYHGQKSDSNLKAIDEVKQKDFAAYVIALRGIDEYARLAAGKIEHPPLAATLGDLQIAVQEMEAKYGDAFKDAAQMAHDYAMGLWEKSHQAGLLDEQTYEDGMTRGFYVPLQRDMSDKDITQSGISASSVAQGRSIVKQFRGSDRDIIDPIDALMQKTFALEKVIAENEVKVALARLSDKAGQVGALVERVPAHKLLGEQYSIQEIARQLTKDPTVSATDAQDLMTILEEAIDEGNRIALFRSKQAMAAGENIVFFWEKGKLAALQIRDGDVGVDIINTLNAVGVETVPLLVDLIAAPSTLFRAAVTSWPDFLLVNFIRDQMSAFVLTEGYTPFVTGLKGVGDELRQNEWAQQYNAAMGTMGGMNTSTLHSARVKRDIEALRSKGYIARVFADKGFTGAIKGISRLTEMTETGTRLGIYRAGYDRAKADGLTDWEASVEASYISTDYIDFGLHGNRMMAWRRLIPFLNAQLQGLYKMARTLGGDEVRQRKGLSFALTAFFKDVNGLDLSRTERAAIRTGRKAWLKMASLGIIGAAIQAAFADDPDYQDASEYLRTTGWVIPIGNSEIFYIPKPFELAMVSNFVERAFEMASGDKEAKWRMLRGMAMNLVPPTNPPAIQAIVEQTANFNFFAGNEIVPDYMRALEPELQYNHYTTEFAKTMGKVLGWSPMRIDHALSAFGASAYRDLSQMYNMTDPSRPASDATDWPITRRFVRDARRGAASSQDFWKFASTVDGSLRRAELTYKNYIESGRETTAERYLDELKPDEQAYALLNTHFKADYKRLNPTYRARQMTTIVSALRRELYSNLGVENSSPGGTEDPFMLSAKEKHDVDELLSEYARREVRNSLIYMKAPGWAGKKPLPTETTIDMMRATQPVVAEEFERRIKKAKVYDAGTIQEYWPEVRNRLIQDRDGAFLKDILAVAKVMR